MFKSYAEAHEAVKTLEATNRFSCTALGHDEHGRIAFEAVDMSTWDEERIWVASQSDVDSLIARIQPSITHGDR